MQRWSCLCAAGAVTALFLTGCAGSFPGKLYDITRYWPIASGNSWTLRASDTGQLWTLTVGARESFAGVLCYEVSSRQRGEISFDYYRLRFDGLYYHGWYDPGFGTTNVLAPPVLYPDGLMTDEVAGTDTTLYVNGAPRETVTYTFTILGEETISTPVGRFDAMIAQVRITSSSGTRTQRWWYARDIGPVRVSEGGVSWTLVDTNMV